MLVDLADGMINKIERYGDLVDDDVGVLVDIEG